MFIKQLLRLQTMRCIVDIPHKIKRNIQSRIGSYKNFTASEIQSDSEVTEYSKFIDQINHDQIAFNKFRRAAVYKEILEHVTYGQGQAYLDKYLHLGGSIEKLIAYTKIDNIGKPRKFYYRSIGFASPTTLRYFATAREIMSLFDDQNLQSITEIGCGYGGQAAVLEKLCNYENYTFYDLPAAQKIIDKFLTENDVNKNFIYPSIYSLKPIFSDLLVSNYAFSELPIKIQRDYLVNIISNSKSGYMTMNSGRTNFTGRSTGKLSVDEIISAIPGSYVLEEKPITGRDNYVIVWGSKK